MNQTQRRQLRVNQPNGLHMRPLQAFVEQANRFESAVQVGKCGGEMFNGKSMIHLLGLGAEEGTEIIVEVDGPDAQQAMDALCQALEAIYDD